MPRVRGPLVGRRIGALTTNLRIHDLSLGGCLIESFHEVAPGRRLVLELDLPDHKCVRLEGETLYNRPDYGFAIKFVNVSDEVFAELSAAIERLQNEAASQG